MSSGNPGKANLRGQGDETVEIECQNHELFDQISESVKDLPVIVKVDVEGFEPVVIEELSNQNSKTKFTGVFIEVSPQAGL